MSVLRRLVGVLLAPVRLLGRLEARLGRTAPGRWAHARRRVVLLAAAAIVLVGGSVHLDRYPELAQARADRQAAEEARERLAAGLPAVGDPLTPAAPADAEVGPPLGVDIEEYVAQRREALREAGDDVDVAVVSFVSRRSAGAAVDNVGSRLEVRQVLLRLPLEGSAPFAVTVDPQDAAAATEAAVEEALQVLRDEAGELRTLLDSDTIEDEVFIADFEDRLATLQAVLDEADDGAMFVHGVVVSGSVGAFAELARSPAVRLVDPAPPGVDAGTVVAVALQPEDTDVATVGQ